MNDKPIKTIMTWTKKNANVLWTVAIFLLSANAFVSYFIGQERDLYFWDFMTYFQKYIILNMQLINDPVATLETVFWSIREDRYNFLGALILTPFSYLFGVSRSSYILAIVNVYALPALIVMILLTQQIAKKQNRPVHVIPYIVGGLILLSPDFWNPILFGFLDIGGVVGTVLILILYFHRDFSDQRKRNLFLMAILIAILVVFRRWYAAWGIAFYSVMLLELMYTSFIKRTLSKEQIKQNFLMYFSLVVVSGLVYFLAAPTYVKFVMNINIVDYQSPYKESTNLLQFLLVIFNSFGIPYLVMSLLGCIAAILYKGTRRVALFLLCLSAAIFMIFTKLQDFDTHHRYLLLPQVIIFSGLFLNNFLLNAKKLRLLTVSGLAVIMVLNMSVAFGSNVSLAKSPYPSVFTDIRHPPRVRNDLDEIERLLIVLEELSDENDRIYVLAGSDILNSHMMKSAKFHFQNYKTVCNKFLMTHYLDIKTGFPMPLLEADYVIVTDPVQQGENIERHRVINIPAEMFDKHEGIARSFEKLSFEFTLESNVKAYLYKKIKPINESDINQLSEQLRTYYPDREFVYKPGDQKWVMM